jgi:hypothetical protein
MGRHFFGSFKPIFCSLKFEVTRLNQLIRNLNLEIKILKANSSREKRISSEYFTNFIKHKMSPVIDDDGVLKYKFNGPEKSLIASKQNYLHMGFILGSDPPINKLMAASDPPINKLMAASDPPINKLMAASDPPINKLMAANDPPINKLMAASDPPINKLMAASDPPINKLMAANDPPINPIIKYMDNHL